jgi:hypothetical protein
MRLQDAEKSIHEERDSWVRLQNVRRIPGGLGLSFSVHRGRRGKRTDGWDVECRGIHEAMITEVDGGGFRLFPNNHPAARQYSAPRAELRWSRTCDEAKTLAALFLAHVAETDDWIPFDRYLRINTPWNGTSFLPHFAPVSGRNFVCRGPDFLIRVYARALEAIGEKVKVTIRRSNQRRTAVRPMVLHFGVSYVVAESFTAQRNAFVK